MADAHDDPAGGTPRDVNYGPEALLDEDCPAEVAFAMFAIRLLNLAFLKIMTSCSFSFTIFLYSCK